MASPLFCFLREVKLVKSFLLPIIKTIFRRERPTGSLRGVAELADVSDGEFVRLGS